MKTPFSAVASALLFITAAGIVQGATPPAPPPASPTLAVVVVDTLHRHRQTFYDYDRIAEEFENAIAERHWPLKVTFERFAANSEDHPLELRLFYRGIDNEFGERVYRAWTILYDHGTKHDFGIVVFRYLPRPGEQMDDVIHKVFRGAGDKTAALIAPFVAPQAQAAPH